MTTIRPAVMNSKSVHVKPDHHLPKTTQVWQHVQCYPCYGWWINQPVYYVVDGDVVLAHPDVYNMIVAALEAAGVVVLKEDKGCCTM